MGVRGNNYYFPADSSFKKKVKLDVYIVPLYIIIIYVMLVPHLVVWLEYTEPVAQGFQAVLRLFLRGFEAYIITSSPLLQATVMTTVSRAVR